MGIKFNKKVKKKNHSNLILSLLVILFIAINLVTIINFNSKMQSLENIFNQKANVQVEVLPNPNSLNAQADVRVEILPNPEINQ